VFAGAAREAVFSNPEVIRRVSAEFVPVALKASLVNSPPDDAEGRLYREIGRSRPAPQGICVVNSTGKVLAWALMFDDDKSVLAFLDHAARRLAQFPDAKKPVAAERYLKYPSARLEDVADSGKALVVPDRHPEGTHCPAAPRVPPGTVLARVVGRALGKDGKPLADTLPQEHYVEDRFHVPVAVQEALAKALAEAGSKRFRLADDLAQLLVGHAYLGQLDVNPLGGNFPTRGGRRDWKFWAQRTKADSKGLARLRVTGTSEAAGISREGEGNDGRLWQHEVNLTWEGIIDLKEGRMVRLLLVARGSEKLKWGNEHPGLKGRADVTILPGGHMIDLRCGVRYGMVGAPVPADETDPAAVLLPGTPEAPAAVARGLRGMLGPAFVVFRDRVQKDLGVSAEQRRALARQFQETAGDALPFFAKLAGKEPEQRERELHAYRQQAQEQLVAFLAKTLTDAQRRRLRQLELQQEGPFALVARPDLGKDLKITDEQRKQFLAVVQEMQQRMAPLFKEAQASSDALAIQLRIRKLHEEHGRRIEAILSEAQRGQWRAVRGRPLDLDE
jgi:hypothetical protein